MVVGYYFLSFYNNGCSDAKLAVEMLYKTGDLAKQLFSKAGDFADGANEVAKAATCGSEALLRITSPPNSETVDFESAPAATDAYKKADQFAKTVQGLISLMENGSFGE